MHDLLSYTVVPNFVHNKEDVVKFLFPESQCATMKKQSEPPFDCKRKTCCCRNNCFRTVAILLGFLSTQTMNVK